MLIPSPAHTFVKICGLSGPADMHACVEAGADAVGINLYPKSKRYLPLEKAAAWLGACERGPLRVALFVNAPVYEIRTAVETGCFDAVQLHGDESPAFCQEVKSLGLPVLRALALRSPEDAAGLATHPADAFILDAHAPIDYGGTGRLSDWALAADAVRAFPDKLILLSGGITPENAAAAMAAVHPPGLDTASGVESAPGVKSHEKIHAFLRAVRNFARN